VITVSDLLFDYISCYVVTHDDYQCEIFYASTLLSIKFPACASMHMYVCPRTLLTPILKSIRHIFTRLTASMHFEREVNASDLGVRRSKLKVTVH